MAESFRKTFTPFNGGDSIWVDGSNAGLVAGNEFFGEGGIPIDATGYIKYWTGSAWVLKPVKYWTGSAWVQKPAKYWTGSVWALA